MFPDIFKKNFVPCQPFVKNSFYLLNFCILWWSTHKRQMMSWRLMPTFRTGLFRVNLTWTNINLKRVTLVREISFFFFNLDDCNETGYIWWNHFVFAQSSFVFYHFFFFLFGTVCVRERKLEDEAKRNLRKKISTVRRMTEVLWSHCWPKQANCVSSKGPWLKSHEPCNGASSVPSVLFFYLRSYFRQLPV